MRRNIKILGLGLLAVFAFAAMSAASASASQPEFTTEGEVAGITFSGSGGAGFLVTSDGKHKVECSANKNSGGKIVSATKTEGSTVTFTSCKDTGTGAPCTSSGQASGTIVTATTVDGELVYWGSEKNKVGVWLKPHSGTTFAVFSCTVLGIGTKITVTGGVIGQITPVGVSTTKFTLKFEVGENKQVPRAYWNPGGCGETLDFLESKGESISGGPSWAAIESAISGSTTLETSKAVTIVASKCA